MAIEFRCPGCNRLLRVGESAAGKQAKCPQCETILLVPAPAAPAPDLAIPEAAPSAEPAAAGAPGEIRPTQIDFGDIFSRTWAILKSQFGMCWLAIAVVMGINFLVGLVAGVVRGFMIAIHASLVTQFVVSFPIQLAALALGVWLMIGLKRFMLKIARGERAEIGDLFTGGPYFLRVLGAGILFGLMFIVGYILCIVPGIILALMFSQFLYLILDRDCEIMESLKMSKDLMVGNKLTIFLIQVLAGIGGMVAILLTCGLGLIVVYPFLLLLPAVIYLSITGQPTAAEFQK
ncbi:MAG: hypothetical protein ABR915_25445 [Thermoguttaceae bacterium]|jgi:hypothetical protein